jgi:plasmid maintenance system antidote protein VapI
MEKQKYIAKLLGITQPHVSMILNGKKNITYPLAKKLKSITHIEIEFWMDASFEELKGAFTHLKIKEDEAA